MSGMNKDNGLIGTALGAIAGIASFAVMYNTLRNRESAFEAEAAHEARLEEADAARVRAEETLRLRKEKEAAAAKAAAANQEKVEVEDVEEEKAQEPEEKAAANQEEKPKEEAAPAAANQEEKPKEEAANQEEKPKEVAPETANQEEKPKEVAPETAAYLENEGSISLGGRVKAFSAEAVKGVKGLFTSLVSPITSAVAIYAAVKASDTPMETFKANLPTRRTVGYAVTAILGVAAVALAIANREFLMSEGEKYAAQAQTKGLEFAAQAQIKGQEFAAQGKEFAAQAQAIAVDTYTNVSTRMTSAFANFRASANATATEMTEVVEQVAANVAAKAEEVQQAAPAAVEHVARQLPRRRA